MILKEDTEENEYEVVINSYISYIREAIESDIDSAFSLENASDFINNMIGFLSIDKNAISAEYEIPNLVKDYLLLIRDTHIEFEKAKIKRYNKAISIQIFRGFVEDLFTNLIAAGYILKTKIDELITLTYRKDDIERYSEIKSPWLTYKAQFLKIIEQIATIDRSYLTLNETRPLINDVKETIEEALIQNAKSFESLDSALLLFEKVTEKTELPLGELHKVYTEINTQIQLIPTISYALDFDINQKIKELPESIKIPVSANRGTLSINEISLQNATKDWIQLEVLPEIYEIWELNAEAITKLKASSKNILNRIKIALNTNDNGFNASYFSKSISSLKQDCGSCKTKVIALSDRVVKQLNTHLEAEDFLNNENKFLASSWRSTLDTASIEESPIIKNTKKWFDFVIQKISKYINTLLDDYEPNASETIISYLRTTEQNKHNEYNSIFLTKSFSGKSFYVPRKDATRIAMKSLDNWKHGYRGGLLVTGNRFCGKTNFLDAFLQDQKEFTTIELLPDTEITFNGRKINTGYDLQTLLNFLTRHHFGERVVLVLDDIYRWQDNQILLSTNIRALLRFVDHFNSKFFMVITMDECQLDHYDKNLNITKSFNSILNLNKIKIEDFYTAIDIRHGATHKSIVYSDGIPVHPDQVKKYISKVYQEGLGNIGDALRIWALSLNENDKGEMVFNLFERKDLPDFFNEDNTIIIKTLALNVETTEYQLRSLLGPSFVTRYKDILSRLISIGIVERNNLNNKLVLTEAIANQVTDKLKCEGYI